MDLIFTTPVYLFVFFSLYFQVFLFVTFLESREDIKAEEKDILKLNSYPSVTIVVPCFNEERTLSKTVLSLLKLDYPKNKFNIFIVDDGSTDNTWKVIERFNKFPQINIFKKENGGKYTALNYALERTTSDLVGCLDADSFVEPDTLKKIVKYFEDKTVMAVTPAIKLENPKNILELVQNAEYNLGIFFKRMLSSINAIQVTPGPFSFFRKKVFDDLGPYKHAHNTEDLEIALRMHQSHYKIVNSHKAFVKTTPPKTLKGLYKQRLRWVHGFLENSIDYKHMFFNRKYGNLGMFLLPAAVISIFSALYMIAFTLYSLGKYITGKFIEVRTIGLSAPDLQHINWFYINSSTLVFLMMALFVLAIFMVLMGRHIAEDTKRTPLDVIYFLLIYGFIVPSWLFMAVYNTVLSKKGTWR